MGALLEKSNSATFIFAFFNYDQLLKKGANSSQEFAPMVIMKGKNQR